MNTASLRIAFRTDASNNIGTGHFMRCLTLAISLKLKGILIRFVCRDLPQHLQNMLEEANIELALLNNDSYDSTIDELAHSYWLKTSQKQDALDTKKALSDHFFDWLIVDHYSIDARWEIVLRDKVRFIMIIDDIADRQHVCDLLIDQNVFDDMQTRYLDKVPSDCHLLLGPSYAILRDEFRFLHEQNISRSGAIKRILVFFGGIDFDNYTGGVIEVLAAINLPNVYVDVVIGAQHPFKDQIIKNCETHNFICHVQTKKMAELMAAADLSIGAGGSATWERCCLGLPTIVFAIAENQKLACKALEKRGVVLFIEEELSKPRLEKSIEYFYDSTNCINMSKIAKMLVDGNGVKRLNKELLEKVKQ